MTYSVWIVFFLIISWTILQQKKRGAEYRRAKAEFEKAKAEFERSAVLLGRAQARQGAQTPGLFEPQPPQGQVAELSNVLGKAQKERFN